MTDLKLKMVVIALTLMGLRPAFAQDQEPIPYSTPVPRAQGWNKGQMMDLSIKRPVVILGPESAWHRWLKPADSEILVANVYHDKKFYLAKIPKESARKLYFLSEPFGGVFAHSMIRFVFNPDLPVRLVAEVSPPERAAQGDFARILDQPILLNDLLSTLEVVGPEGSRGFSLLKGMTSYYSLAIRMTSLTGRNNKAYLERRALVHQYPTNFSTEEAQKSLLRSLELSQKMGANSDYHLLFQNCNVLSFDILRKGRRFTAPGQSFCQRTIGYSRKILERIFPFFRWHPPLANLILQVRGYKDSNQGPLPLLNDDPEYQRLVSASLEKKSCEDALKGDLP